MAMINPEITEKSDEVQEFMESSFSYPGISANIIRPKKIRLSYLNIDGEKKEMEAEDFLSSIIQHEIDYLDGVIFLDYLSPLRQNMLLKKMKKFMIKNPPHIHNKNCNH
jgi:peptide deformylase